LPKPAAEKCISIYTILANMGQFCLLQTDTIKWADRYATQQKEQLDKPKKTSKM